MSRIHFGSGTNWPNSRLLVAIIGSILVALELGFGFARGLQVDERILFLPLVLFSTALLVSWVAQRIRHYRSDIRITDYAMSLISVLASAYLTITFWQPGWYVFAGEVYALYFFTLLINEYSRTGKFPRRLIFHPQMLFAASFLVLIILGTFLLMIPNATYEPISWQDALFTSASSVCVTGLVVMDTASEFTRFGQAIILALIQIGGLGVMTFTSFFGFFLRGTSSLHAQLTVKELLQLRFVNARNFVLSVVILTLVVEIIGITLMWFSIDGSQFQSPLEMLWFCVFHSISSFCNAGFTTIQDGFSNPLIQFNYGFQWISMVLIVLGGIGFFMIFNFFQFSTSKFKAWWRSLVSGKRTAVSPWILNLNSRLVIFSTAALILSGWLAYLVFEDQHSLQGHTSLWGKITVSMFGAVTPRTAGFNVVDMGVLSTPTLLFYLVLMWIGASPGSTGGGIKTTTFSVAVLNVIAIIKGKRQVEVSSRTVSAQSIHLAFATVFLSIAYLGLVIFVLLNIQPELELLPVVFECFSALGTVGLSLGATQELNTVGKLLITFTMYFGRVGLFVVLMSLVRQVSSVRYRYPDEEIIIT